VRFALCFIASTACIVLRKRRRRVNAWNSCGCQRHSVASAERNACCAAGEIEKFCPRPSRDLAERVARDNVLLVTTINNAMLDFGRNWWVSRGLYLPGSKFVRTATEAHVYLSALSAACAEPLQGEPTALLCL
jgi:hypothetical protein